MDKVENLQRKARAFSLLIKKYAPADDDAGRLLAWLTPRFSAIAKGEITPPHSYEFRMALGKEPDFYERHQDVRSVEADFICALEDWESQEWCRQLKGGESRR